MSAVHPRISVAVPLHNEAGNILSLYREIRDVLEGIGMSYETILINDASTDETPALLRMMQTSDPHIRVIEHHENYGQAAGLSTAFQTFRGDILITMDGDGQNDPYDIPLLLEKINQGYRVATGWRTKRQEPYLTRILPSRMANWIISKITGIHVHDNGCSLKAYRAEVVRGVTIPHGFHRFLPAILGMQNREVAEVRVSDRMRMYGKSHYGLKRTWEVIRDLLSFHCVLHNPQRWRKRLGWLVSAGVGMALILAGCFSYAPQESTLALLLACLGCTALIYMVHSNVHRFMTLCLPEKVFRKELTSDTYAPSVRTADVVAEMPLERQPVQA
nr:glycosyltransferase family 2 protein [Deltaproteobacteria bacterium]